MIQPVMFKILLEGNKVVLVLRYFTFSGLLTTVNKT